MIEAGHAVSQKLAGQLGFAEYARHCDAEDKVLVLYERG